MHTKLVKGVLIFISPYERHAYCQLVEWACQPDGSSLQSQRIAIFPVWLWGLASWQPFLFFLGLQRHDVAQVVHPFLKGALRWL